MAADRSIGLSELARLGFDDLDATVRKLDQLVRIVGDNGRRALASLGKAQDPNQGLNSLLNLAEAHNAAIKASLKKEETTDRICMLLGASSALGDFVNRYPAALAAFEERKLQLEIKETYYSRIVDSVAPLLKPGFQIESAWTALRRSYREQLLRIAIFDVTHADPQAAQPEVAAALADIAGGAIEAGLLVARAELKFTSEFGAFTEAEVDATELAVIAMGKCGARELNYISDVDVIYVAESNSAEVSSERAIEIATKLATRMMRAMDGTASEPALWQVDPNLRPEGKSGALVRTLDSHIAYYDRWAQSWEFQALLKARHLAGTSELGDRYVAALNPKVWESAKRENFVESVQKMRERVTEFIPANEVDLQIKLGPGGLRDVEFTVQLLQLVHGRSDASVHARDTISAINSLAAAGYIGRSEANRFAANYRFLRLLEHRIQLADMRRTHLMPTSPAKLRSLARAVDRKLSADELLTKWEAVKVEVRALHQQMFYRPLLAAVAKLDDGSLALNDEQAKDRLHAIGFSDAKGALEHIAALTTGLSRRAAIQKQLLPVLLQWFAEGTDPDAALLSFRRLSEDLGESHWYLRMLRDSSGAAQRMTQVLSNSRLATALFEKIPEAAAWFDDSKDRLPMSFDELTAEFDAVLSRKDDAEQAANVVRGIRRRETLRIAMGAVLGDLNISQLNQGLSDLTATYLKAMLSVAVELRGADIAERPVEELIDFGIVAMGRFGGEELGFGSDADVMFVHQALEGVDSNQAQKVAERLVSELRRLTADFQLEFELDLDLRPEGKNGPITRSLDSYAAYYERWANTWEAQALIRARTIAGSEKLQSAFTELINQYRYPSEFSQSAITEIRRIKARVETERLPQGADPRRHLKLGRGSLSDVEWLVQLLQLQHGAEHPAIRTPQTIAALKACVTEKLIEEHDATVLIEAWLLASRIRSASVLWANKRTDVLPVDRRQLEGMARILEYAPGSASKLEEDYLAYTRRARTVYERLFFAQ